MPYLKFTIERIIEETKGVKTFHLAADSDVFYKAGQFLTFVFDDAGQEQRRSYSLSSSPDAEEPLAVTIKRVTNGRFSRPLTDEYQIGDQLLSIQPTGQFILPEDVHCYRQIFFFAAGIGITPVFSMLKTALIRHPHLQLILFYSNSSYSQTVFYKELLDLQRQYPEQLKLEFLFSSSPDLSRARLSKWLLPQLLTSYSGDADKKLFYTCGPLAYMRMVMLALVEQGYSKSQIKKEVFDTTLPVRKLEPEDKSAHQVTIEYQGQMFTFTTQYPVSILEAARRHHISLPYSCETGKCGSCLAQCVAGKIWMSYNEVLTDDEISQGKFLTCTGFPVDGDVSAKIG